MLCNQGPEEFIFAPLLHRVGKTPDVLMGTFWLQIITFNYKAGENGAKISSIFHSSNGVNFNSIQ